MQEKTPVDGEGDGEDVYGDALVSPAPGRPRRDAFRPVAIALFAALLAVCAGSVFVASGSAKSWFPSRWDPRIAPIAAEVARLRGLDFEHPVPVR